MAVSVGRVCDIVVIAKMSSYLAKLGSQSITLFFFLTFLWLCWYYQNIQGILFPNNLMTSEGNIAQFYLLYFL